VQGGTTPNRSGQSMEQGNRDGFACRARYRGVPEKVKDSEDDGFFCRHSSPAGMS